MRFPTAPESVDELPAACRAVGRLADEYRDAFGPRGRELRIGQTVLFDKLLNSLDTIANPGVRPAMTPWPVLYQDEPIVPSEWGSRLPLVQECVRPVLALDEGARLLRAVRGPRGGGSRRAAKAELVAVLRDRDAWFDVLAEAWPRAKVETDHKLDEALAAAVRQDKTRIKPPARTLQLRS